MFVIHLKCQSGIQLPIHCSLDSNPDPESLQATGPCFSEAKTLQAEAKNDDLNGETGQTKEIIAPNGRPITAPNRGTEVATISFMSLKSILVANQEPSPEGGTGLQPDPMTATLEQDNQVANLRSLTNERTHGPGAILPPLNQSTQTPRPTFPNALMNPPWKILSLEVSYYIDQRTLHSKLIAIFE
ncbi:hypothetical protein DSO57_1036425 [Entomophthora muscae]|uniref:Uncharacterized protein n=1 Tax=Entomophthora muscae TaxID=34485 RepID=A0ACC2U9N5_9FUNG|nr:hypothetical protein DSO57_1036425 [Entomophthora muscae]